uniref:Uncharacterized protein n=1 Tax=Anopheles braziliensis TaxID=58242 RepID=A0A2M3ZL90_9DIPT
MCVPCAKSPGKWVCAINVLLVFYVKAFTKYLMLHSFRSQLSKCVYVWMYLSSYNSVLRSTASDCLWSPV